MLNIPVSYGEIVDKLSILSIKLREINFSFDYYIDELIKQIESR